MRAFWCSAKSRKVISVGSPEELPKATIVPRASTRSIAAFSEAPPALSRISAKRPLRVLDPGDDLAGAEPVENAAASRAADNRGDPRAGARGELHGEVADPAGGAGHQHPLPQQRRAVAQAAQRGQPGDRQAAAAANETVSAIGAMRWSRHRGALGPALPVAQRDDPRAGGRAAAVRGGAQHHPGDVLAGAPTFRPHLEQAQFAAVEREGMDRNERLIRPQLGLGDLADRDRLGPGRGVDDGEHGHHRVGLLKTVAAPAS